MSADVDVARDRVRPVSREHERAGTADFDEFYRRELPGLLTLARALGGAAAADDIAQEAMLATYRRWDEVRRLEEPARWARRTCSNLAVSAFRRRMVELRGLTRLAARRAVPSVEEASEEFWRAVAGNGLMNLHVVCHYGKNSHHIIEGIFKATARALRQAVEIDPRAPGVPSTKGVL